MNVPQDWPPDRARWTKYHIHAREPEQRPWSVIDLIRGLVDVGRVHESALVTRITRPAHPGYDSGLIAVEFYAPYPWAPQPDPSLEDDRPYYAGGPDTRYG